MKVREYCKDFEGLAQDVGGGAYAPVEIDQVPTEDEIIVESARLEDEFVFLRFRGVNGESRLSLPDAETAEKLCVLLSKHLDEAGTLTLRQLGDIEIDF